MKKKKFKLENLEVHSFVTGEQNIFDQTPQIKAGADGDYGRLGSNKPCNTVDVGANCAWDASQAWKGSNCMEVIISYYFCKSFMGFQCPPVIDPDHYGTYSGTN